MDYLQQLRDVKLLPLYTATTLDCLDTVEELLVEGGVPMIEVTYRSRLASDAIRRLSASGRVTVGAGTVRSLEQAKDALACGARFLVTPGLVEEVLDYCRQQGVLCLPGVATPSELQIGLRYGISVFKFFPANVYGGLEGIKALSGPYYDVSFLPTGGVNEENYLDYLGHKSVAAVGGSFILSEQQVLADPAAAAAHLRELVARLG